MKDFEGKVAVITGGANGIGRALADRSARAGMKVVVADIEEAALAQTEKEMRAAGATVLAVKTDVSKATEVEMLARKTLDAFGAVHLVFNNAGVFPVPKPVWETTLEDWQWCLGVNLWGVIHGIRTFVPLMLKQGTECHMVNTASVAGLVSLPYISIYHATKHAVVSITECLHHELLHQNSKLRVSVLCPGFVRSKIMESDRKRTAEFGMQRAEEATAVPSMLETYRQSVEAGLPAEFAAEQVFHALWHEYFYIHTTNKFNDLVRARAEGIVGQKNPVLAPELLQALGIPSAPEKPLGKATDEVPTVSAEVTKILRI